MRAGSLPILVLLLTGFAAATAAAGSPGKGPYTRNATARCLATRHIQIHEGTITSPSGKVPDLTFRYEGSELTIAFMPAQTSGGAVGVLGQAISNAFARVDAALEYASNAVYYDNASNLTAGEAKLITGCLR